MKLFISVVTIFCIFQACTKPLISSDVNKPTTCEPPCTNDSLVKLVAGRWDWIKSEGGISYRVENPANTGNQQQLQFNNNGTVDYFKNGVLKFSGSYSIASTTDPSTGLTQLTISQNYFGMYPGAEAEILHLTTNDMTFDEPGADRFSHVYKRLDK
ncbi:MAG: hypothetical protein ABJA90_06220 [Ginsengibacter sp.]